MITGNHIRAARALIDVGQATIARAAGISVSTLVHLERSGTAPVTGLAKTLQSVVAALEARGVNITGNGVMLVPFTHEPLSRDQRQDAAGSSP